ncbi:hypothetical protein GCM10009665_07040 [Kitasatospora nipponensis]|uniref:SLC26A/SulP transporter domain-containing protein n=1 Tax=Kitasatospora nipponensis TaxID=258049 RepID=A0ABN1VSH0_9ACTN
MDLVESETVSTAVACGQEPPGRLRGAARLVGVDLLAGLITALFSIPEGMAYAAFAGFDPVAGLYAGVAPAVVGSLLAGSPLMVTTLTSAIALTSRTALHHAHLAPGDGANVAALGLLVGAAMAAFAALRVGSLLRLISPGAMAGFSAGIAVQIIAGALPDATGYRAGYHNRLLRIVAWALRPQEWSLRAALVAAVTVAVWALAHAARRTRPFAVLAALVVVAGGVWACRVAVPLASSLGAVPSALPSLSVPAWDVLPRLVPGASAVALVALAQAAGIHPPPPERAVGARRRVWGSDLWAQAAANLVGAFFQALPAGGSLSRTGVAVAAGARTRWAGAASGVLLAVLVLGLGDAAGRIPLPVIGALLIVIGVKLITGRLPALRAAWRDGRWEQAVLAVTFLATTQFPLQYALLLGLGLSLVRRRAGTGVGRVEVTVAEGATPA